MFRVLELVGLLAPLAAVALLVTWRDRVPARAMTPAVVGVALAALASGVAVVGERAVWFGGGDGVMERLELLTWVRWVVVAGAIAALSAAGLTCRDPRSRPWTWVVGGWGLMVVAVVAALLTHVIAGASEEGLSDVVQILGDTVQFAALGLAVLVLCVGVAAGRGGAGRDAGAQAVEMAGRAWRSYTAYRGARR